MANLRYPENEDSWYPKKKTWSGNQTSRGFPDSVWFCLKLGYTPFSIPWFKSSHFSPVFGDTPFPETPIDSIFFPAIAAKRCLSLGCRISRRDHLPHDRTWSFLRRFGGRKSWRVAIDGFWMGEKRESTYKSYKTYMLRDMWLYVYVIYQW